jgi:hypothetical protein
MEGVLCVTIASSDRCSSGCPDLLRIRSDMGLRRFSRDFPAFCGGTLGVDALDEFVSFSLMPVSSDVWDRELSA